MEEMANCVARTKITSCSTRCYPTNLFPVVWLKALEIRSLFGSDVCMTRQLEILFFFLLRIVQMLLTCLE